MRDEAGRFAKETKKPAVTVKPAVKPVAPTVRPAAPGTKAAPPSAQNPVAAPVEMKAPQSFRGPAKEAWAQTPELVRVEVLRREKEIATQLTGLAEDRKTASAYRETVRPFEAQIRAEGSTPEKAIGNLLNTAMALRTAPPAHKARLVAEIITSYGVPLEGLVAALQGQPMPQGQPQQQQQNFDPAAIAQRVEQQLMERLGSQRDSALMARAEQEIATFIDTAPMHGIDGADFSEEIRQDMADLMDAKAKRGSTISLRDAYALVARAHPEVSKVLAKQERAVTATKAQASTQQARAASSSVRHQPATQPVTKADSANLRSALDAAYDSASER